MADLSYDLRSVAESAKPCPYLGIQHIAPEHVALVTRPLWRAASAGPGGVPRSAEDILLRQGFVKADEVPAGAMASYVRETNGASIEIRVQDEAQNDINLYLHEGEQAVLLRNWDLDNYENVIRAIDEIFSFADGVEAYRAANIEYGFAISPCGTVVADITADQFDLADVVVTDDPRQRWELRYPNELYADPDRADSLHSRWLSERGAWIGETAEVTALNRTLSLNP